jgi:GNAT superfamily N-acetyltransferase
MTPDELFHEAIVSPRYAFERFDGLTVVEREGWLQLIAPAFKQGGLNGVAYSRLPESEADAVIADVVATYQRLGVRWRWTVTPDCAPADLGARLARHGLVSHPVRAMTRGTEALDVAPAPGVTVERVDESTVDLHADTMARGWGTDPAPLLDFDRLLLRAPGPRHALFLARVDGIPAGASALTLFERSAYLIGAVVLPAFRRRGAYRALVDARLAFARAAGRTLATSHANVATSAPLLAKLGFTTVCDFTQWNGARP